jgi:signal transduction histidine kinase
VIDNGDGVPEALTDRIFERFVHRGRAGVSDSVGLGLAIVHALAQGMGGSVMYHRVDGLTIFTVRLPLAEELNGLDETWEDTDSERLLETRRGTEG